MSFWLQWTTDWPHIMVAAALAVGGYATTWRWTHPRHHTDEARAARYARIEARERTGRRCTECGIKFRGRGEHFVPGYANDMPYGVQLCERCVPTQELNDFGKWVGMEYGVGY